MNYKFVLKMQNQFYLCPIDKVTEKSQQNKINQQLLDMCRIGNIEKVIELVEDKGANLHLATIDTCLQFTPEGSNPLHIAAANGYNEIVNYLIDKGTDIHCINKKGESPIHLAVFKGRNETIRLLFDKGTYIDTREEEGDTPLAWACYSGYSNIVELLIEKGANINSKNKLGYTPLHWACYIGHLNVVRILVEKGADVTIENQHGETPICCASNCGREDVYIYLLKISTKSKKFRVIPGSKQF